MGQKATSSLAAWVCEFKREMTTVRRSCRVHAALGSRGQDSRWYRNDDMSNPLEGSSRSYSQEELNYYHDED